MLKEKTDEKVAYLTYNELKKYSEAGRLWSLHYNEKGRSVSEIVVADNAINAIIIFNRINRDTYLVKASVLMALKISADIVYSGKTEIQKKIPVRVIC